MPPLRIVFCGTPAFAVPALRELIGHPDFLIEGVVTQPDRPRGRGGEIFSSPGEGAGRRGWDSRLSALENPQ